ncbi:MAG TPA: AhpC/TSA family protein, partial [Nitrospirae bacterium]|nr:AhpC/TSA family protein [Nitrospirota bacterium]
MSTQLHLQSKLDQLQRTLMERSPDEVVAVIRESMKLLSSSGMIEKAIKTGDLAPDFTLQTGDGKQV